MSLDLRALQGLDFPTWTACSGFGPPVVERPQPAPQPAPSQPDGGKNGQPVPSGIPRVAVSPYIISTYWMAMAANAAKGTGTTGTNTGTTGTGATGQGGEVRTPDSSGGGRGFVDSSGTGHGGGGFDDAGVSDGGLLHRNRTWLVPLATVLFFIGLAIPIVRELELGAAAAGGLFLFSQDNTFNDKQS